MGRTQTQLRQEAAIQLQLPFISGTADTGGSTTTLKDLPDLARFADDEIVGMYLYLSSGSPTYKDLRITDHVQSTGVSTFIPAIGAAPDALTYELLPFPADAIHEALKQALLIAYDSGILVRKVKLVGVTGSPLYNGFPEYWTSSSALDGWTTASLTLARSLQTTGLNKLVAEDAATFATTAGTITLAAPWRRFLQDFVGSSITARAWLRTATASSLRIRLLDDNGTALSTGGTSSYHSGDGEWELVSLENTTLTSTLTEWRPQIQYAVNTTTDVFGGLWLEGGVYPDLHPFPSALLPEGPSAIYTSPLGVDTTNLRAIQTPSKMSPASGWTVMRWHDEAADVDYSVIRWGANRPPAGRLMWLVGDGPFTLPSADTGVVEINRMESILVAKMAALILLKDNPNPHWAQRINTLQRDIQSLSSGFGAADDSAPLGLFY